VVPCVPEPWKWSQGAEGVKRGERIWIALVQPHQTLATKEIPAKTFLFGALSRLEKDGNVHGLSPWCRSELKTRKKTGKKRTSL
jgi:hypothetical protein